MRRNRWPLVVLGSFLFGSCLLNPGPELPASDRTAGDDGASSGGSATGGSSTGMGAASGAGGTGGTPVDTPTMDAGADADNEPTAGAGGEGGEAGDGGETVAP